MPEPTTRDIIGKAPDGHWQYFSGPTSRAQNLGAVRRELRDWTHTERELPALARTPVEPATKDRVAVALDVARAAVVKIHPYLESREILG